MSNKEIERLTIIRQVSEKKMCRKEAITLLSISYRQLQRLLKGFNRKGPEALVHGKCGKPSSNKISAEIRHQALCLVHERYSDFGPSFAAEKLTEKHGIKISIETLRQWMIADNLWIPRAQRKCRVYQPRNRRDCFGELVQIDGSHHDWFEGRSDKCCLLVFIDDATGKLMNLRFSETESAFDYMVATQQHVELHGRPVAYYSDRHSVFHISKRDALKTKGMTQFGRALHDLNIELICANSSQAKGRVERVNLTLQDRLIKEMRLEGINSIDEANSWLPAFIESFNRRFAIAAKFPKDMHRPVEHDRDELNDIFSWQDTRKLSKALTLQYDNIIYIIDPTEENTRLARETIKVLNYPDGRIALMYEHRKLSFKLFNKLVNVTQGQIVENKRLGHALKGIDEKQKKVELQQKIKRSQKAQEEELKTVLLSN